MEPIGFVTAGNSSRSQVPAESPAMPMGNTYQIARPTIPDIDPLQQWSNNDAVTISPEAQAAANVLAPAS